MTQENAIDAALEYLHSDGGNLIDHIETLEAGLNALRAAQKVDVDALKREAIALMAQDYGFGVVFECDQCLIENTIEYLYENGRLAGIPPQEER